MDINMSKKSKLEHPSAAAEKIAGNEDLMREFLLYLPPRSLLIFKLVSKQWRSLISDPQFGRHHTLLRKNRNSSLPSGIYFYNSLTNSNQIESVSLSAYKIPKFVIPGDCDLTGASVKVTHSCSGLYLIRYTSPESPNLSRYVICNITTGQSQKLDAFGPITDCRLAYNPSKSPHYKVVRVKKIKSRSHIYFYDRHQFEIYSSETGNWKVTDISFQIPSGNSRLDNGVYWNGAVHWIISNYSNGAYRFQCYHFDVEHEKFSVIDMPPKRPDGGLGCIRYFGECNGYLHLVYVPSRVAKKFHVLEMDRDTLKWHVKYRVHVTRLLAAFPEIFIKGRYQHCWAGMELSYVFTVLCVVRREKEEDSVLVFMIPGKVLSYNFTTKKTELLSQLAGEEVEFSRFDYIPAFPFVETLHPMRAFTG